MACGLCPEQVTRPGQRPTEMQNLTDHSLSAPDSNRRRQQASMELSKITIDLHVVFTKASLPLSTLSLLTGGWNNLGFCILKLGEDSVSIKKTRILSALFTTAPQGLPDSLEHRERSTNTCSVNE